MAVTSTNGGHRIIFASKGVQGPKGDDGADGSGGVWGSITGDINTQTDLQNQLAAKKDDFTENTGFNKNFGSTTGTACQGDDSRLSDSRTPTAHTHLESEITDLDKYTQLQVDTSLALKEDSFVKQSAFNKDFGVSVSTVCEGNDSRLSDARTPLAHTHLEVDITDLDRYTQAQVDAALALKEDSFTKNTAFNTNFGALVSTTCEGNDPRLSDNRDPNAHTHLEVDITDLDKYTQSEVNVLLNGKEDSFSKNTAFNKNFGSAASTVCEGNDARVVNSVTSTNVITNDSIVLGDGGSRGVKEAGTGTTITHSGHLDLDSLIVNEISEPSTPATGKANLFLDSGDGELKAKFDDGAIKELGVNFRENLIIDGQFNHWDDGAGPFTATGYTATMWYNDISGMISPQVQRVAHTAASNGPYYTEIKSTVSDTVNDFHIFRFRHRQRSVQHILGRDITLKIRVRGSVAGDVGFRMSGTSLTAQAEIISITTSFADYIVTIPINTRATVAASDNIDFNFDKYLGTTHSIGYTTNPTYEGTLDIDEVSILEGSNEFNGIWPTPEEERMRIGSYYENSYNDGTSPGASTNAGAVLYQANTASSANHPKFIPLLAKKITTPTVNIYSTTGAINNIRNVSAATDYAANAIYVGNSSFVGWVNPNQAFAETDLIGFHYVVDSRL